MKTTLLLKPTLSFILLITLFFGIGSCNQKKTGLEEKETTEEAKGKNDETFITKADEKDALFLVKETENALREVKLAQLAVTRFSIYDVKDLATMLLTDHGKMLEEIQALALRKEIAIPTVLTKEGEESYKKLMEKQGKSFDQAYCEMMIDSHLQAIDRYERAMKECADVELKEWAANTLATLRNHLEFSVNASNKLKKIEKI